MTILMGFVFPVILMLGGFLCLIVAVINGNERNECNETDRLCEQRSIIVKSGLYLVCFYGCVEPELLGPFVSEQNRFLIASDWWAENGDEGCICKLDINEGVPVISQFVSDEL